MDNNTPTAPAYVAVLDFQAMQLRVANAAMHVVSSTRQRRDESGDDALARLGFRRGDNMPWQVTPAGATVLVVANVSPEWEMSLIGAARDVEDGKSDPNAEEVVTIKLPDLVQLMHDFQLLARMNHTHPDPREGQWCGSEAGVKAKAFDLLAGRGYVSRVEGGL